MGKHPTQQFELVPLQMPPEEKGVVVFVHGILGSNASWDKFRELLIKDDWISKSFDLAFFSYSSRVHIHPLRRTPSIKTVADQLATSIEVETKDYERIVLVGHSQGGLVIQRYLAQQVQRNRGLKLRKIRRVVLFGCPNTGSEFAKSLRRAMDIFGRHPQEKSLRPFDEWISNANRTVLEQIVHAETIDEGRCPIPVVAYAGTDDKVVTPASARGTFPETGTLNGDHTGIIRPDSPGHPSYRALLDELRKAKSEPFPVPTGASARAEVEESSLTIGAKVFLESNLLCELVAQVIERELPGAGIERRFNIGETAEVFAQLRNRAVDLYVEYTGTLLWEHMGMPLRILRSEKAHSHDAINSELESRPGFEELRVGHRLGFSNSYNLVMLRARAEDLGLKTITDLARHTGRLTLQSHYSFPGRPDGLPGLRQAYPGLDLDVVSDRRSRGYEALRAGGVDLITAYTTDPEVVAPPDDLVRLEDDQEFFGLYYAIPLTTRSTLKKMPTVLEVLGKLRNKIDEATMSAYLTRAQGKGLETVELTPPQEGALRELAEEFLNSLLPS